MFQIKNFLSITASMVNYMRGVTTKITDFNVGSIARTMVEAPAIEMDQLYQQMVNGLTDAIPVSVFTSFNFPALTAQPASGPVRVVITASVGATDIPANTIFSRPDGAVTYASIVDIVIPAGSTYGDVPVTASVPGSITNTLQNTQFTLSPAPAGFVSASNLAAFSNGSDSESQAQQQTRFQAFIQSLPRSTVNAILYGAKTTKLYDANGNVTEQVATAKLIEPYLTDSTQPVGLINIYIHNGVGSTSAALVAAALQTVQGYVDVNGNNVPGYKAAGTVTTLVAATEVPINVAGVVTVQAGYNLATVEAEVQSAIYAYILGLDQGATCQHATLDAIGINTAGVVNFVLSTPTADVTSLVSQKLMPGTLAIT